MQVVTNGPHGWFDVRFGNKAAALRAKIVEYMRASPKLVSAPSGLLTADGEVQAITTVYCDGEWVWSEPDAVAFQQSALDVSSEFVTHVVKTRQPPQWVPDELGDEAYTMFLAHLKTAEESAPGDDGRGRGTGGGPSLA